MTPSIYMCAATQFHRKYQNYEDYHFLQIEWDLWKRAPNVTVRPFKLQTTTRKDKKEEKKKLQTALTSFLAEHRLVLRAPCFQLHWDFFLPCTVKQNPCSEWEKTGLLLYKNLTSCSTDAPQTHSRLKFSLKKKKKNLDRNLIGSFTTKLNEGLHGWFASWVFRAGHCPSLPQHALGTSKGLKSKKQRYKAKL